ncbi:hypothetical protein CRG98_029413 [Punica granatum]|uniref:Uncharacterized protein n=1 Tax=Punica granatum TaxID=22663 RepID=A0A2I0J1Q0_PUNGR|nr:hypothetical protein CRG98_029413 [Punica granatum]
MGRSGAVVAPIPSTTATDKVADDLTGAMMAGIRATTALDLPISWFDRKQRDREMGAVVALIPATTIPNEVIGCP